MTSKIDTALNKLSQARILSALNKLQANTFEGHRGRPGERGGSLPKGAGQGGKLTDYALDKTFAQGGITIKSNGLPNEPTKGYVVARHPERGYVIEGARDKSRKELRADIKAYAKKNSDLLGGDEFYLGLWLNNDNGALYLDTSSVLDDLEAAKAAGRDADQIAIWDIANMQEIPTGGSGKKGIDSLE